MSGSRPASTTIYLRPIAYEQPYRLKDCAAWMYGMGRAVSPAAALKYLKHLEYYHPWSLKAVLAGYYNAIEYRPDRRQKCDIDRYHTSNINTYGQEPHMWF